MKANQLCSIILAAGSSTRMKSPRSKLLHEILGKTLARRAYDLASSISDQNIFVVGHQAEALKEDLGGLDISFCLQDPPLGTGDALKKALALLSKNAPAPRDLYVAGGDSVLLRLESLKDFYRIHRERSAVLSFISCDWPVPSEYGRVKRDLSGNVQRIVEFKNADSLEKSISEINAGFYLIHFEKLKSAISSLQKNEVTGEFYLTDLIEYFYKQNELVLAYKLSDFRECMGVNTMQELSAAQRVLRDRLVEAWMTEGVFFQDPASTWLDETVELESGVQIGPGVLLKGKTKLAAGSLVEAYAVLRDSSVGKNSKIKSFSVLEEARLGESVEVGPYARLRPGTRLDDKVKIGNFVETKNSHFKTGAKANHLSYVGDAEVGESSNIGAGTITCNYDGFKKHKTQIGKNVFIGSNTSIVAPLEIGDDAIVGAGSVITKSVEKEALAVERSDQRSIPEGATKFRKSRKKV